MARIANIGQIEDVLMIVKAYPTPSRSYGELVCTAGIRLRDMTWIRIYPYPFRLLGQDLRFKKWSVMRMPLAKATGDPRPDSYSLVDAQKIVKIRDYDLNGDKYWSQRMPFIQATALTSVAELQTTMLSPDKGAWGPSILPVPVEGGSAQVSFKRLGGHWSPKEAAKLEKARDQLQQNLFVEEDIKQFFQTLNKVPYRVYVSFEDRTGMRYKLSVLDWEIGALWFKARQSSASDQEALEKIRQKIENQIFDVKRDTYLVLGSMHHRFKKRELLAIDAFVWPEKSKSLKPQLLSQPGLFGD